MNYKHWKDVPEDRWPWSNFTPFEMRCRGTNRLIVVSAFMDRLQYLREEFNKPLIVSSGYRDPTYNNEVSKTGLTGPHTTGCAVDLLISGEDAYIIMYRAYKFGFTGIGIHQRGSFKQRFVHLDDLIENRPRIWTY